MLNSVTFPRLRSMIKGGRRKGGCIRLLIVVGILASKESVGLLFPARQLLFRRELTKSCSSLRSFSLNPLPSLSDDSREVDYHGDGKNKSEAEVLTKSKLTNRGGGRSRRYPTPSKLTEKKDNNWTGLVASLAIFALLYNLFISGGGSLLGGAGASNYYYYQSSFFESQTFSSDGKVDTARRESIRTNVPSLLQDKNALRDRTSSVELEIRPVQEFEQSLDDEIGRNLRLELGTLDDFF